MKTTRILIAVLLAVLLTGSLYAQKNSINDLTSNKYALQNLVAGIQSDNTGVKRSSIYFAGKYRIAETESALIAQLKQEKDPSTRILIALVLYEMGSVEGLIAVKELAQNDKDAKVRRMSTQIYNEYLVNDAQSTASISK
jgi:HEAT repeats